jgi:hypothetical protein
MNSPDLHRYLDSYLSVREALGFQMSVEHTLLRNFVQYIDIENAQVAGPIRAQWAVDWACASSSTRGTRWGLPTAEHGPGLSGLSPSNASRYRNPGTPFNCVRSPPEAVSV